MDEMGEEKNIRVGQGFGGSEKTWFKVGNRGRRPGSKNKPNPAREAVKAWCRGDLKWKLKPEQVQIYEAIRSPQKGRKTVIHCSRRFGKTFLLACVAIEDALREPDTQISFICPTQKNLKTILHPIFTQILKDCPDELRPVFRQLDGCYKFKNGSMVFLFGADAGNMENIRGQKTKRALIDEAGFVDELRYLVDSILMPQLLTTDGTAVLSSSSPLTPDHEFVHYINEAKVNATYFKFTIHQAGYDPRRIWEFAKEAGGERSTVFRREYLCELVLDEERALCPEWRHEFIEAVERDDFFKFYSKYVALDSGVRDMTVGLFGYYDFKKAKLIIEDEMALTGKDVRTDLIAAIGKSKEEVLEYKDTTRYGDNDNLILLQDLTSFHDYPILSISKDSLEAMVNQVRLWVKDGRILIHPRCTFLLATLEGGMWNKHRTEFDRSEALGHMDAFAALMYMVRCVDVATNPVPGRMGVDPSTHYMDPNYRPNTKGEMWKGLLNLKPQEDDFDDGF